MSDRLFDVALVTYRELPELDPDDRPLAAALRERGLRVAIAAWDDPAFDWSTTRLAMLRNPWDYFHRLDEFLAWADATAARTELLNPPELLRWNLHKGYLHELEGTGAPVVPTALLRRGATVDLAALAEERGWSDVIVKPAVSADSWETHFVPAAELARGQAAIDRLLPERDLLVQPFLHDVEASGERCLIHVDGAFSHAIRKNPLTQGGRWAGLPEGVAVDPEPDELVASRAVLAALPFPAPLYARVDLIRDAAGAPRLLELELAEPTLFLTTSEPGLRRLVDALLRRLAD